jgi:hypothetical protein
VRRFDGLVIQVLRDLLGAEDGFLGFLGEFI